MSTFAPGEANSHPIEINGHALVSDDDRIASHDGLIPASLRNEKDWDCFQRALADSDLVVLGRRSHDLAPNVRGDQRLVISRGAAGLEQHANVWWWNPARVSWAEVAIELLPRGRKVAVPGGQVAFDLFLKIGFDAFHLTRAHGVRLPGGERFFRVATLVSQPRPYSPVPDCASAKKSCSMQSMASTSASGARSVRPTSRGAKIGELGPP
jgi:hypothetical protein